jgi:hypothetical protein
MPVREPLIVYGNCQAEAITSTLAVDPLVSSLYDVAYYRSFEHPVDPHLFAYDRDEKCRLLWEQHDPKHFPKPDLLAPSCLTVRFPSVDLNLLWPFNCVNPYNAPEPPLFPFGRYPYGDRIVVNAINRGMPEAEILDYYLTGWDEYKIDLDRLLQLEAARMQARETHCDVGISDFVFANFHERRLFWTVNHPTSEMLAELMDRLLRASDLAQPALQDADVARTLASHFGTAGPLGVVSVPVHPKIAEHFNLQWYDPDGRYSSWDGGTSSYVEYFKGMIAHAFRMREGGAAPTQAQ